jgi:arylsulfatase A-like enzyme
LGVEKAAFAAFFYFKNKILGYAPYGVFLSCFVFNTNHQNRCLMFMISAIRINILFFGACLTAVNLFGQFQRPNILLILTDDLGKGDVGFSGGAIRTPNIDAMAKAGMILNHFYANSTVCSPSRASLMSGRYPDMVGVPGVIRQQPQDSWGFLDPTVALLPAYLKTAGYQTGMIGKWHLGLENPNLPNVKGFDYFKGFLGDMMDDYYHHRRQGVNWMRLNEQEIDPEGHATELFTNWAIEWIDQSNVKAKPFFLFLSYNAPHFPIQPPAVSLNGVRSRYPTLSDERQRNVALVEDLDAQIGRVIRALEKSKQLDNTLILFVSDNGGSLPHAQSNGQLRGGKQDFFEGGIQVPAFVFWKDRVPAGKVNQDVMLHMDILPTLLDIAGSKIPSGLDGVSFRNAWQGKETRRADSTIFWVRREGGGYNGLAYYAARNGNHKIYQNHPQEPFQYVDLNSDPLERNPVPAASVADGKFLMKALMEHIRKSGAIPWQ